MRVYQAFGKLIDLEAVAVISGGPPSAEDLLRQMRDGGALRAYLRLGDLTVQLVEKPVELWARLTWAKGAEPTTDDAVREAERLGTEWDQLVAAWKAVKA